MKSKWYKIGKSRGENCGLDAYPRTDWMSGRDRVDIANKTIKGIDDGDPAVLDLCPNPLSGEWAGESLKEIFGRFPTEQMMTNYEQGFQEGFFDTMRNRAEQELNVGK